MRQRDVCLGMGVMLFLALGCRNVKHGSGSEIDDTTPSTSDGDSDGDTDGDTDTDGDSDGHLDSESVGDTNTDIGDTGFDTGVKVDSDTDGSDSLGDDTGSETPSDDIGVEEVDDTSVGVYEEEDSETDTYIDYKECKIKPVLIEEGRCLTSMRCPNGFYNASCSWEEGNEHCTCGGNLDPFSFDIPNMGDIDPCDAVLDICKEGAPILVGAPKCESSKEWSDDNRCGISADCVQTIRITDEYTTEMDISQSIFCEAAKDNQWECMCETPKRDFNFTLPSPAEGETLCGVGFDICTGKADVVVNPASCVKQALHANHDDFCTVRYKCTQTGERDGEAISLEGEVMAYCEFKSDNTWLCNCEEGTHEGEFSVNGPSGEGWDVCTEAGAKCEARFDSSSFFSNADE